MQARLRAAADVHVLGVRHALGGPAPEARLGVLLVLQRALLPGRQVRPGAPGLFVFVEAKSEREETSPSFLWLDNHSQAGTSKY